MGGHPVPYDFTPFLDALGDDWSDPAADPLLAAWLAEVRQDRHEWVQSFGRLAATLWKDMADFVERPENLPRVGGKGPYDNNPQQVVLPAETWETLGSVHGSGIWQEDLDERARYAAVYLLNQNGEAGIACSVACTDGMLRVLRAVDTTGPGQEIVDALHAANADSWLHGAQFVTEIQGGSDAATNAVVAAGPDEDGMYALHGQKWFCSNLTADWWLVTARPQAADGAGQMRRMHDAAPRRETGSHPNESRPRGVEMRVGDGEAAPDGAPRHGRPAADEVAHGARADTPPRSDDVALFLVPRDQPGYTIERLKDKLGTRALPTAEIMFRGAQGWPVGPLDAGLRTMVEHVLVTSRIHNIVAAAAFLRRAHREASAYAGFRTAFGQQLDEMPMIADSLHRLARAADHAEAGAFRCVDLWLHARGAGSSPTRRAPEASDDERAFSRIIVSIAKAVTTRRLPGLVQEAMMVLGGNGIEERFTVLPRLYRDAAILETWEGPYTLLLDQAWRDLRRIDPARREAVLAVGLGRDAEAMASRAKSLLDAAAPDAAWREWCHDVMDAFEARALQRLAGGVRLAR